MKTYKVLVLGTPGSGKTVFLASLYHQLLAQSEEIGFSLEIDANHSNQRKILNEIYKQIANPQGRWPAPNLRTELKEWNFTCYVQTENGHSYKVLEFTYLDYPGEWITIPQAGGEMLTSSTQDEENTPSAILNKAMQEADAFLCLLDGQKLLELMTNEVESNDLLLTDLSNIIGIVARKQRPVHFVITKWDLFSQEDEASTLMNIRKYLFLYDPFRNFVKQHTKISKVRLIPISSVGFGFAQLQSSALKTEMKKIGENPRPLRVEIPLICVLPDLFTTQYENLLKEKKNLGQELRGETQKELRNSLLRFGVFASSVIFRREHLQPIPEEIDDIILLFGLTIPKANKERLQKLRKERKRLLKSIRDQTTATRYTAQCFDLLLTQFEEKFPASDLSDDKLS